MYKKKLLFMEDLLRFFRENNLTKFSSSDSGYKLCVQVPTTFEIENKVDDDHRGMMKLKCRIFHLDSNKNGSFVSKKAAKEAMPTIKNRPVMAYIHQLDNGEWDFEAHNMTVETDENGNDYYEYQEKQVGSFDESEPFFEYDEELDKTYVCSYAYISEDYTRACDIIRRKGWTKTSVELAIEELAYNAKEGYLDLQKFYVSASTLLGSYNDGTKVEEGMQGSRADIVDFSAENNSVLFNKQELINEVTNAVIKQLSNKQAENSAQNLKEGGNQEMDKFNELLAKYDKKIEDVTFDYENMTDEELEVAFASAFEAAEDSDDSSSEDTNFAEDEDSVVKTEDAEDETSDTTVTEETFGDDDPEPDNGDDSTDDETQSVSVIEDEDSTGTVKVENSLEYSATFNGQTRTNFATLNEQLESLWTLVNEMYGETDNEWYQVDADADKKKVYMYGWKNSYRQSYKVKGDVYSLVGERTKIYSVWVSEDEKKELDKIRSNYSSIESELNQYKAKELHAAREEVLASEDYAVLKNDKDFKELKENMDNFSVEELANKADLIFAKFMKASSHKNFAANKGNTSHTVFMNSDSDDVTEIKLPYGGLFKNFKTKK